MMQEVHIDKTNVPLVNVVALDQTLKAACPHCTGISTSKRGLRIHFEDNATDEELNKAKHIALKHDPEVLVPDQVAAKERRERIETLKAEVADAKEVTMETLLKRIELLELTR